MDTKNYPKFAFVFDFMCKCGNADGNKYIKTKKKNKGTLLCLECERKYEITLGFSEVK